ncbi:MAG: UvrB/UvrC motif-containing protein [Clostridia bacterium]|nr:UvrB/UvrC motif-containing protein [Clostridia bacterium]
MLCDKCKQNNATFHSTVNVNGQVTETHLCENCAKGNKLFSFNEFLNPALSPFGFFDSYEEPTCDSCGFTLSDFRETGLLGCAECYKTFNSIIKQSLQKIQPSLTHVGKKLNDQTGLSDSEKQIKKLEVELKNAVNEENYELASEIKKKIIALKEANNE